jgi:hypothetical protein
MANKPDGLAGTQRAAILLMSLGEQDAANLLKQLDATDVQKLGLAMAELQGGLARPDDLGPAEFHRRGRRQGRYCVVLASTTCGAF